ncbi:MAG: 5-oxoprolinase subunit PxpA [Pedobacter sp.]
MLRIDLNCDMGEGFGKYQMANDEKLMDYITSANIACGFHAGDPATMYTTVKLALQKGVAIGAHPGLPDLQGFGRRELEITDAEAYQLCLYQMGALDGFVKALGGLLNHVKPHGALYNMAAKDLNIARALATSIKDFNPNLKLYALAGSQMITAAEEIGLTAISEVFADRTYQDDGSLTPRSSPNALIADKRLAAEQVLMMVKEGKVVSQNNHVVAIVAETICLHGDAEHALPFAQSVAFALKNEGINIKARDDD